jgi:hypothetical protein
MTPSERMHKRNLIAQWAFDTSPILGRFHLWLEDVEVKLERHDDASTRFSFLPSRIESMMAMTAAVTALGTRLYGRYGEGKGQDKRAFNQIKKESDAISAYAMSESLWYATRQLPENHAIMVSLGEGLMPKLGETPEMGSNPQLGFGRVYARPQVAKWVDSRVARLINERGYTFEQFYDETKTAGITVWGAAIDTLENTSRFAQGQETGPLSVLHLFDQPLQVSLPYEGYVGTLFLPKEVVRTAADRSVLINFRSPRARVAEAIEWTYPGIRREHIHVWTLGGSNRDVRLGTLWKEWKDAGAHIVEDGFQLATGGSAFVDSGSYAPTYHVRDWKDSNGETHIFLCDGYAGSAEAMASASLAPVLDLHGSLAVLTSKFALSWEKERDVMGLSPDAPDFATRLRELAGSPMDDKLVDEYGTAIRAARDAGMPVAEPVVTADDFFPERRWRVLAASGYMCPDPYTGARGVERVGDGRYRASVALATRKGRKSIDFTFRMMEEPERARLVFNPLLNRFFSGEDYRERPVRISDSGRIRNELQTLCSEALSHVGDKIRVDLGKIPPDVISKERQKMLIEILAWYKKEHPVWFRWLEIVNP